MKTSRSVGRDAGALIRRVVLGLLALSFLDLWACGREEAIESRVAEFLMTRGWYAVSDDRIAIEEAATIEVLECRSTDDLTYACDVDFNDELAASIERGLTVMGAGPESARAAVLRTICVSLAGGQVDEVPC